MKIIGAAASDPTDMKLTSADGKTVLIFSFNDETGRLQVHLNGDWLQVSANEARKINNWLAHKIHAQANKDHSRWKSKNIANSR